MTKLFEWIEQRLDEGGWIRRAYLVAATVMTWKMTVWSMLFAETSKLEPIGMAAVLTAIGVPIAAIQSFAFKAYLESRK